MKLGDFDNPNNIHRSPTYWVFLQSKTFSRIARSSTPMSHTISNEEANLDLASSKAQRCQHTAKYDPYSCKVVLILNLRASLHLQIGHWAFEVLNEGLPKLTI